MTHNMTLVILSLLLSTSGCGDDGDEPNGTESTSAGGAGNAASGQPGPSDVTVEQAAAGACDEQSPMTADCDTAPYLACAESECSSEYKECLGANYKSGDFSGGTCQQVMECSSNADDVCENDCESDAACDDCLTNKVGTCVFTKCFDKLSDCIDVDLPGLGMGGGGATEAGCAELSACCATLSGEDKQGCDELVKNAAGTDLACGLGLVAFQLSGQCS